MAEQEVQRLVKEKQGSAERVGGAGGKVLVALAVATSLFHLYAAYEIVPATVLRTVHVALVLALCFLSFPLIERFRGTVRSWDWLLVIASFGCAAYLLAGGDALQDRAAAPTQTDLVVGTALVALVLEAVRRASGWIMPVVVAGFLAYAVLGNHLPPPWTHRGYDLTRMVGHMVMTLEGIYGAAVDVSSTLIILFTIFGAFLSVSGAGKFFIDFSVAAMGRGATLPRNRWSCLLRCLAALREAGWQPQSR